MKKPNPYGRKEIWLPIKGYENRYAVSNKHRVKLLKDNRILKQYNQNGYWVVSLYKDLKQKYLRVHRLMAIAFIPNPQNKPHINHKDCNRGNNRLTNLEWVTCAENTKHGIDMKGYTMTEARTAAILKIGKDKMKRRRPIRCVEDNKEFVSIGSASKYYNISRERIRHSINKKMKTKDNRTFEVIEKCKCGKELQFIEASNWWPPDEIAERLKKLRKLSGMTIMEAEKATGVSHAYLNKIEIATIKKPTYAVVFKLRTAYESVIVKKSRLT